MRDLVILTTVFGHTGDNMRAPRAGRSAAEMLAFSANRNDNT
jgi:hypothetical protein